MIVVKFGGTSVGDADAIDRAAAIVRERLPRQPMVVVSALGGATNALIAITQQASEGQLISAIRGVEALRDRHMEAAERLLKPGPGLHEVQAELGVTFEQRRDGVVCG